MKKNHFFAVLTVLKNGADKDAFKRQGKDVEASSPSLKRLAIKGTAWTVVGFGSSMIIRLGGNLVLTRLLFPEAFGLMALVNVFLTGAVMFSDLGIAQSIVSSKQGDEPEFYNTAWTIQIMRGLLLTIGAGMIVLPFGRFYDEPMLIKLLPVACLTLFIAGFNSTKLFTAHKHLNVSKLIQIEVFSQVVGLVLMIVWAWAYRSVWALVFGSLVSTTVKMYLSHVYVPGAINRFCWNAQASRKILNFGKWIFFSTMAGFIVNQSDRIILGKLLDPEMLGIYSIAFGLGSLPMMILRQLSRRILFPLLAKKDASTNVNFRNKVLKMRALLTLGLMIVSFLLALSGPSIICFLYDERYHAAGIILSALALAFVPRIIVGSGNVASLARGDSKRFSIFLVSYSITQLILMTAGAYKFGIWGLIGAIPLIELIIYPVLVWSIHKYRLWMPLHDLISFSVFVVFSYLIYTWLPLVNDNIVPAW